MDKKVYMMFNEFIGDQEFESEEEFDKKVQEFIDKYNAENAPQEQTELDKAYELLDKAMNESKTKEIAIKRAKEAYEICNDCLEAIIFLAEVEDNANKSLEIIEGPLVKEEEKLKKEGYFKKENIGHFYEIFETREYIKLLKEKGIMTAKSGRFKLAANIFEEIIRLNKEDDVGAKYDLMKIYAYLEDEEKMLKVYNKYKIDALYMLFPMLILYYKQKNEKQIEKYLKKIDQYYKEFLRYYKMNYEIEEVDKKVETLMKDTEMMDVFDLISNLNFILKGMNSFDEEIYEIAVRINLIKPKKTIENKIIKMQKKSKKKTTTKNKETTKKNIYKKKRSNKKVITNTKTKNEEQKLKNKTKTKNKND